MLISEVHFFTCDAVQHLSVSQFPCARTCDAVQGLSVSQFPAANPLKLIFFILVSVYSSVIVSSTDLCFNSQNHVVFRMICGVSFLKVFVLGGGLKGC